MKVVVIMGVFNRAAVLRRVLDAVGAQTCPPHQIVIVDDGSTDGSGEIAAKWLDEVSDRIPGTLRTVPNGGCGAARNRGLEVAGAADGYHFLDSDDVIPPDFHERAIAALVAHPEAVAASADQEYVDLEGRKLRERPLAGIAEDPTKWLASHDTGIFSATVVRAETVRRFGPMREGLSTGDDTWFLIPASRTGSWLHLSGAPVRYGVFGDNMTASSPDSEVEWARVAEGVLPLSGLPWKLQSGIVSRRWGRAGRSQLAIGRTTRARECFLRAIRHRPLYVEAWWGWIQTWMPSSPRDTSVS